MNATRFIFRGKVSHTLFPVMAVFANLTELSGREGWRDKEIPKWIDRERGEEKRDGDKEEKRNGLIEKRSSGGK